jgi:hypothetical protein
VKDSLPVPYGKGEESEEPCRSCFSLAKTLSFSCHRELWFLAFLLRNRIHPHLGHPSASMCFQFSSKLFLHGSLLAAW